MKKLFVAFCCLNILLNTSCDYIIPHGLGSIREIKFENIEITNNFVAYIWMDPLSHVVPWKASVKLDFQIERKYDDELYMEPFTDSIIGAYVDSPTPTSLSLNWTTTFDKDMPLGNGYIVISVTPTWGTFICQKQIKTIYLRDLTNTPEVEYNIPIILPDSFYNNPDLAKTTGNLSVNLKFKGNR